MKTKNLRQVVLMSMIVLVVALVWWSCEDSEFFSGIPETPPSPTVQQTNGNETGIYADPVVIEQGDSACLVISKECSYTDPDGTVYTCEPKTTIKFYAPKDTVYVDDFESLLTIKEKFNSNTNVQWTDHTTMKNLQKFGIGNEWRYDITFDMAYDVYHYVNSQNETIDLAYFKTNSADCNSADAKDDTSGITPILMSPMRVKRVTSLNTDESAERKVYDVTATFNVDLEGVDPQASTQNVFFEVHFVGVVEGSAVTYRKSYEWFEPHDNLPIRCDYIVYRDSRDASGEIVTEEARSQRCSIEHALDISKRRPDISQYTINGATICYLEDGYSVDDSGNRSYTILYAKTAVPDLSKLSHIVYVDGYLNGSPGEWNLYFNGGLFNQENPQPGWYMKDIQYRERSDLSYDDELIRRYEVGIHFYDRFLYVDNQLIDFLDEQMTYDYNFKVEDATMSTGEPAKVFTHECTAHYLGKDFYIATVDSVYQYTTPPF